MTYYEAIVSLQEMDISGYSALDQELLTNAVKSFGDPNPDLNPKTGAMEVLDIFHYHCTNTTNKAIISAALVIFYDGINFDHPYPQRGVY